MILPAMLDDWAECSPARPAILPVAYRYRYRSRNRYRYRIGDLAGNAEGAARRSAAVAAFDDFRADHAAHQFLGQRTRFRILTNHGAQRATVPANRDGVFRFDNVGQAAQL